VDRALSRHHLFDPEGLPPAIGFSYGAVSGDGRILHLAGITGERLEGGFEDSLVDQFADACRGVARVITTAGGEPSDLVSMTIYTTVIEEYKESLKPIGAAYREVFGRHYPPMALIGVSGLFDPSAKLELVCVAVVPGLRGPSPVTGSGALWPEDE
jgi:enamine deaminase RidA (YjgF/YER057c/UK114 family)